MKVIIVAIVSIAVLLGNVYASEETCNAGESKFDGCNTCTCSNTGVWACTEKLCYRQRREEETCNAGESKFDGCNTCTCSNTGVWGCTQKLCYRQKREEGRCTNPGESKFDGCNTCTCTKTGIWACTRKLCFRRKRDEDRCKNPGETKSDGCNTCTCTNTGVWACTKKLCLRQRRDGISLGALEPISRTRRELESEHPVVRQQRETQGLKSCPTYNNVIRCNRGEIEKIGCYTYNCSKSGAWVCIENSCGPSGSAPRTAESICTPGEKMRPEDCVRCTCTESGLYWFCWKIVGCLDDQRQTRNKLETPLSVVRERRDTKVLNCPPLNNIIRCSTGNVHKSDCYTYICSATGIWICTDDTTCPQGPSPVLVPFLRPKRSPQELDCPALNNVVACTKGEIFKDGCYTYICSDTGVWVCTEQLCRRRRSATDNAGLVPFLRQKRSPQELDCPALNNVVACNEGEHFQDGCYTYMCSDTGIWVCTEQLCRRRRSANDNAGTDTD